MDLLSRPRALRAILELAKRDKPVTMQEFVELSSYSPEMAGALRQDLLDEGLITCERKHEGRVNWLEIALTSYGRRQARLAQEIDEAQTAERQRKRQKT